MHVANSSDFYATTQIHSSANATATPTTKATLPDGCIITWDALQPADQSPNVFYYNTNPSVKFENNTKIFCVGSNIR
jgi:hypothetical protein